jgi:murein DD-endopeptidase MepM/ murein hydrolase activator NlpD
VRAAIVGPLESALVHEVGAADGRPLTQVAVRALVWWVSVPKDLRRGDVIELLYHGGEELRLDAIRFHSEKLGRTFAAYRYQASADKWPRLYQPDGAELELRLKEPPLDDYTEVTSLLSDGRGHQGVDFKTPQGTPVKAPFEATVQRINWKTRANGTSAELAESGGRHRTALFLHLSELAPETRPGAHLARGQLIGLSGNTGHSFAPHLHYQLQSADGKLADPFAQDTVRRSLPAGDKPAFEAEMRRLDALFDLE